MHDLENLTRISVNFEYPLSKSFAEKGGMKNKEKKGENATKKY